MTKCVVTRSGSRYELDEDLRRVRRLSGEGPPTERQGPDGVWKAYERLWAPPAAGEHLLVIWRTTEEGVLQTTRTSPVVSVAEWWPS